MPDQIKRPSRQTPNFTTPPERFPKRTSLNIESPVSPAVRKKSNCNEDERLSALFSPMTMIEDEDLPTPYKILTDTSTDREQYLKLKSMIDTKQLGEVEAHCEALVTTCIAIHKIKKQKLWKFDFRSVEQLCKSYKVSKGHFYKI